MLLNLRTSFIYLQYIKKLPLIYNSVEKNSVVRRIYQNGYIFNRLKGDFKLCPLEIHLLHKTLRLKAKKLHICRRWTFVYFWDIHKRKESFWVSKKTIHNVYRGINLSIPNRILTFIKKISSYEMGFLDAKRIIPKIQIEF